MKKSIKIILATLIILTLSLTATVIGVLASDTEPTLQIKAANVSFKSTVHLYYAVAHDNIEDPENIKLLVWKDEDIDHIDECTVENAKCVLTGGKPINENGIVGVTFDYDNLAAAEMTKNVYARAYTEVDGEIIYSPVVKYSILQYSLNMLGVTGTGTQTETLKTMLSAMLEYGAAAQLHFEPEADRPLANESFVKIKANGGTFEDGYTNALVKLGESVTVYAEPVSDLPYVVWTNGAGKQVGVKESFTVKATENTTYTATSTASVSSFGSYEHVVIIGVDGAGAFPTSDTTSTANIDRIFADGSVTNKMRVTSPTSSAASWASMLHGTLPYHNGIYENYLVEAADATYPINKFPSFLKHIVDLDSTAKVAVYSGWSGITNGILEDENLVNIPQTRDSDVNNVAAVKKYIAENSDFKALFLQLNNPDAAGHNYDYTSQNYYEAIQTADAQIGEIYDALDKAGILDTTLFIVTADHGGTSRIVSGSPDGTGTHGGLSDVEKYTKFAVSGYTVDNNETGAVNMQMRDTASIVLYALGFEQPDTYTSRIPAGIFYGYTDIAERPVYVDPDNPRDYVSVPTPEFDTTKDTVADIDNELMVYLPFDNSTSELVNGNRVESVGTITYENGYFGNAVVLDDGHLVMDNFDPGTESFTVSMWVKTPSPEGVPPIIASRDRVAGGSSTGFLLAMRRTATASNTTFTLEWSYAANGKNAPDSYSNPFYLPEDFNRGWFHVTCIVNRDEGTISMATDFDEFKIYNSSSYLMNDLTLTNDLKQLVFGDDLSQSYSSKMGLSIDEFMIFKGALDRKEVNKLAKYYNQDGVPTIGEIIGADPTVKVDFNGTIANTEGGVVNVVGTPTYGTGVSGQSLLFANDKTFVKMPDIKLGTNDFAAAFWLDINSLSGSTIPIFSTQHGQSSVSLGGTQGITFSTGTKSATGEKYFEFYFGNGSKNAKIVTTLPENVEDLGWMHVIVSVDRETSTYNLYIDFKLVTSEVIKYGTTTLPATWTADGGRDDSVFTLGDSGSGAYWNNLNAYMDDFMLFDSALARRNVKALANYYGKEGEITISDYVGYDPSVELNFNESVSNSGSSSAVFDDTNVSYVDTPFGTGADFTSVNQNKGTPEYWANSSSATLAKEQAGGGYNSLTISLWLSLKTDMIKYHDDGSAYQSSDYTSANGAAQWQYGDRVLFATHDYSPWNKTTAGEENDGMNVFLYAKPSKIKASELPAYMNTADFTADANGYLMYNSGEFAGEYIYRQRITVRFRLTKDGAMYAQQFSTNMYAALNDWTNIVMVIDRGDYGADNAKFSIYQDGVKLETVAVSYYDGNTTEVKPNIADWNDAILDTIADYATLTCGKGFMINDDVGHYPRDMESYLDEFVIFDEALTESEIAKLLEYYDRIRDAE